MPWSEIQQKHLSIWPHFTGTLSMIGSGLIIHQILRSPGNRQRVYHRILLAMSICDFNTSFWYFLSTWPIPQSTPNVFAPTGTQASCTAQGFFIQFGIATPLYNAALAFYYLLTIRYQWREIRMKKAEKYLLAVPFVWAAGTSLAALGMTLLNNANLWCWISSVPLGCKGSIRNDGVNDCERGNNQWLYRWIFFYGPLWAAIFLSGVAMLLTYLAVVQTEKASSKWAVSLGSEQMTSDMRKKKEKEERDRRHSKKVSSQAFYYLMAFFFSWTPATLTRFIQMVWLKTYYPLILLMAIFTPMQGFLNYLVYMRPRWIAYRNRHPEWGLCKALAMMFQGGFGEVHARSNSRGRHFSTIRNSITAGLRRESISRRSSADDIRSSVASNVISEGDLEGIIEEEKAEDDFIENKVDNVVKSLGDGSLDGIEMPEEGSVQNETEEKKLHVENGNGEIDQ